ncbi:MAG: hypothetical protein Q8M08_12220 [Bacteroidales bacterium]|nr:hypothetical protein [Bacteroidales bacterium]
MEIRKFKNIHRLTILLILCVILALSCNNKATDEIKFHGVSQKQAKNKKTEKVTEFAVDAPPFSYGIYPCTDCHANFAPKPEKRELVEWHDDISAIFNHDSENRWCLDCHDLKSRDSLRLASGKLLDFKESYKLCGQCHGEKLRDWKVGVHGKRTGFWNGKKEYLLCVHCHDPHAPKFKEITPEPPPVRQEDIK